MDGAPKVLVVGLDSADVEVARGLMADGGMPTLRGLLASGFSAETVPPIGLFGGTVWPSFFTGVNPSRHGRYCFRQLVVGTYTEDDVGPGNVEWTPFWHHLSDSGLRVGVFDVPHTNVRGELNGLFLAGWGAHDSDPGFVTSPISLHDDIERRFGDHPVSSDCNVERSTAEQFAEFRDQLLAGIDKRVDLASHFLANEDLDLFLLVFSEAHCVGHQCWSVHDETSPHHDPAVREALGEDPVTVVYEAIDSALGAIIEQAGEDTTVLVFLSHGMAARRSGNHLLDDVLWALDQRSVPRGRRSVADGLKWVWHRTPRSLQRPLIKALRRSPVSTADVGLGPTWGAAATRRYFLIANNDTWGGIRLNLVGREPAGRVTEDAYDVVCDELIADLGDLVNEDTGEKAVVRVVRTRDVYSGERIERLPDLLVQWNQNAVITTVTSTKAGRISKEDVHVRSGDHREPGLLVAVGPRVVPGEHPPVKVEAIPSTIASLLGVELPDVDEAPLSAISGEPVGTSTRGGN